MHALLLTHLSVLGSAYAGSKMDICHNSKLISVSSSAWGAHQSHGDWLPATSYADRDGDGYGDAGVPTVACAVPPGFVANGTDCDDAEPARNPGEAEVCNDTDDDCDGLTDEGEIGPWWFMDADFDGFGDGTESIARCSAPVGYTADASDCDDTDPGVNPNASETCSPVDDDCDGLVNESDAADAATWYEDADGDGSGSALAASACDAPPGWVPSTGDCDDTDPLSSPSASERCDGADNDCDGSNDEDAVDATSWYADADADGFGDAELPLIACEAPAGHVADASDCDDGDALVSPAMLEWCNLVDDDCDGVTDEPDALDAPSWYADTDADGFGDIEGWAIACAQPAGYVADASDCDDLDLLSHPSAPEVCDDGIDQSCDGEADEGCAPPPLATFPLEVIGENGTIVSMTFPLSEQDAARPTLYLQIHDLDFDGEGAVQLNDGPWWTLQDELDPGDDGAGPETVHIEVLGEAAAGYGGIGGLFGTLKLEVSLPPGALRAGENTLSFQFVHTDGVTSGFRVLDVDLRDVAGVGLFADAEFAHADPNDWTPVYTDAASLAEGERLWREAALTEPNNGPISAHCADCHTQDGRDLKYFGYSDHSIVERAKFHDLTALQGELIASYIRSLPVPSPGRPWNPPYQPGPDTDSRPVSEWAAGAGIEWILDDDEDAIDFVFPNGPSADEILAGGFSLREIPIAFQLLDWNHWLPPIHPRSGFAELPLDAAGRDPEDVLEANLMSAYDAIRADLAARPHEDRCAQAESLLNWLNRAFQESLGSTPAFEEHVPETGAQVVSPEVTRQGRIRYSTALWYAVKRFELHQEFELETCGPAVYGAAGEPRQWFDNMNAVDPAKALAMSWEGMPNYDHRQPRMAQTYHTNAWWYLQLLTNSGGTRGSCQGELDWGYFLGAFGLLEEDSGVGEPGRAQAIQRLGFQNVAPRSGVPSVCSTPLVRPEDGWEPTQRGSIQYVAREFMLSRPRIWDEDGRWVHHDPSWQGVYRRGIRRHDPAALYGAWMTAMVHRNAAEPNEAYQSPHAYVSPLADPTYDQCDWETCWTVDHWINEFGEDEGPSRPLYSGWIAYFRPEAMVVQTWAALVEGRGLFVDPEIRQEVADWAATMWPLVDWQSLVDDLGPQRFADWADPTFDPVAVEVDPGTWTGTWTVYDNQGTFQGPATVWWRPGRNAIIVDGIGRVDVLVYPDGGVVPFDDATAVGGVGTLTLRTHTVQLDPNGWLGYWGLPGTFAPGPARSVDLVGGLTHRLDVASRGSVAFHIDAAGNVIVEDPASADGVGSTLRLLTAPVTFAPGSYAEGYGVEYGPGLAFASATQTLVRGLDYLLQFGSGGGTIVHVDGDGAISAAPEAAMYGVGSTLFFEPVRVWVDTTSPGWSTERGPLHAESDALVLMPSGWYQFGAASGTRSLSVGAGCALSPSAIELDGHTLTFSCSPWTDPTQPLWYADLDEDGFGDASTGSPRPLGRPGETIEGGDCDDADPLVAPGVAETWYDGVDQDCSGGSDFDQDGDGSTSAGAPDGSGDDCDDLDGGVFAGAPEFCDGRLNGCASDGAPLDESGTATWFPPDGAPPVDVTAELQGAPGAPVAWDLPNGEVALCDGTWYLALVARTPVDVVVRGPHGSAATVLSAEGVDRGLLVTNPAAHITLDGLTLTNGVSPTWDAVTNGYDCNGGGVSLRAGSLTVMDSAIVGNSACNAGGGIHVGYSSPTLVVLDSAIDDNLDGGGVVIATGSGYIERSTIDWNVATRGLAGGLGSTAPSLTVLDTSVSFNTASEFGGMQVDYAHLERVTVEGNSSHGLTTLRSVTLVDGVISGNAGSGVYVAGGGTLMLDNTVVEANSYRGAYIRQGGTVTCLGAVGLRAGFFRNPWGAAFIADGGGTLDADTCDFGVGADDNNAVDWDVFTDGGQYEYGDDVSVTCTASGCF